MVTLALAPARGNPSSRYFPHHGYLGLTPVRVDGIVRTRLDEDRKPAQARAITVSVRCYEERVSRTRGTLFTHLLVDHTQVLWAKHPRADAEEIGDLELPFRITLPKRTAGFSTANFQAYRTFWRIEAALEHIPIPGVGHRLFRCFDLALVRYDEPTYPSLGHVMPSTSHALLLQTSKPRAPVLRYSISTPTRAVGPTELVYASLSIKPVDPDVVVRSASFIVERRIDLFRPSATSPTLVSSPPPTSALYDNATPSSSSSHLWSPPDIEASLPSPLELTPSSSTATFESSASSTRPLMSPSSPPPPLHMPTSPTLLPSPPLLSPTASSSTDAPHKTLVSTVVTAESSGLTPDAAGVWSRTLMAHWPPAPPRSRWAVGETMRGEHAVVRFFVRASVRVAGPGGAETLELEPREIAIAGTSEVERQAAREKYVEQREGARRSKSKSPWRAERGEEEHAEMPQSKSYPGASGSGSTGAGGSGSTGGSGSEGARAHGGAGGRGSGAEERAAASAPARTRHKDGASSSSLTAREKAYVKSSRRPHTSAGPRDKSSFALVAQDAGAVDVCVSGEPSAHARSRSHRRADEHRHARRESGLAESVLDGDREIRERERERRAKRERTPVPPVPPADVRAWDDELARIELKSKRASSHMLGSWALNFGRRKQVSQRS
ncbi:hypothetical protein WOLCODRAFT_97042 [Wolfiporia cocos MD-104 SS10]|uniref:Uncharacterized protein n=1 Tax=Wolfiporia cocos (strain MD-104) TaxID=742152 RepID=A0A2H3JI04_WOLCO|nr:hypothetical protein WOLCODRAFT_97042 [Wolfiporia cocos MD-104 SS10]